MNVIPFRRAQTARPDLSVALRRDLSTGLVSSGLASTPDVGETDLLAALLHTLEVARQAWTTARLAAPIAVALPAPLYAAPDDASDTGAAIASLGLSPRSVDLQIEEAALARTSLAGVDRLRARGFGIALALDPGCPLPIGARERALFTEFLTVAPQRLDAFHGCDGWIEDPLAVRVLAARECGLPVTATGVGDEVWARALAKAGFARAEGPYAGTL